MFSFLAFSLKIPSSIGAITDQTSAQIISTSHVGDVLIIAIGIVAAALFGFLLDKHNMLIGLLATYIGWLGMAFFPYQQWGGDAGWVSQWWFRLILLAGGMIIFSIILSSTKLFRIYYIKNFLSRWLQAAINGMLYAGLLIAIVMSTFSAKFLTQFSDQMLNVFVSETGRFIWIAAPLVGLFLTRNKRSGPGRPAY